MEKEKVHKMRIVGMSYSQISAALNISENTIKSFCRRNNLKTPVLVGKSDILTVCRYCGKTLQNTPKRKPKKFCSDKCRLAWWNINKDKLNKKAIYMVTCACCGKEFDSYGNKKRRYCSHFCYIKGRFKKTGEVNDT